MFNKPLIYLVLVGLFLPVGLSIGQNTMTISKKNSLGLGLSELTKKSLKGQPMADSSIWINYTTLLNPAEPTLSISAEIGSGQIPEGFQVYIEARPQKGITMGNHGTPTGKVPLGHMPRVILDNIGTSYTGTGKLVGHQVIISFEIVDFALIQPGATSIYIQFTLN